MNQATDNKNHEEWLIGQYYPMFQLILSGHYGPIGATVEEKIDMLTRHPSSYPAMRLLMKNCYPHLVDYLEKLIAER